MGLNIELYLSYDEKAFRMALSHFFIFEISISIFVVYCNAEAIKNLTKTNWAGRAPTASLAERIRLVDL